MTYSDPSRKSDNPFDDVPAKVPTDTYKEVAPAPSTTTNTAPAPSPAKPKVKKTTAGSMWAGLVVSAILLIVLLVFILQNQQKTELNLFAWSWNFPAGVGMLFAAILGALITALIGGWRMMDLRRQIRKGNN